MVFISALGFSCPMQRYDWFLSPNLVSLVSRGPAVPAPMLGRCSRVFSIGCGEHFGPQGGVYLLFSPFCCVLRPSIVQGGTEEAGCPRAVPELVQKAFHPLPFTGGFA